VCNKRLPRGISDCSFSRCNCTRNRNRNRIVIPCARFDHESWSVSSESRVLFCLADPEERRLRLRLREGRRGGEKLRCDGCAPAPVFLDSGGINRTSFTHTLSDEYVMKGNHERSIFAQSAFLTSPSSSALGCAQGPGEGFVSLFDENVDGWVNRRDALQGDNGNRRRVPPSKLTTFLCYEKDYGDFILKLNQIRRSALRRPVPPARRRARASKCFFRLPGGN